jgi:peptidoglycan/LPS O-acetylase OafA/YrhL
MVDDPELFRMGLVMVVGLMLSFAVAYGLWYGLESEILRWKDRNVPSTAHAERAPLKSLPSFRAASTEDKASVLWTEPDSFFGEDRLIRYKTRM